MPINTESEEYKKMLNVCEQFGATEVVEVNGILECKVSCGKNQAYKPDENDCTGDSDSDSDSDFGGGAKRKTKKTVKKKTVSKAHKRTKKTHLCKDGVKRTVYTKDGCDYVMRKSAKTGKTRFVKI